jgi:shikimate kinase
MNNIYLVGFMGTGKTTVGKALASKLKRKFIDLDDVIEQKEGSKITDIFASKGETYFRDLESEALREIAERGGCVSACGGGIVLRDDNIKVMKDSGDIICFDASPEVIYERTKHYTHRPLLNVKDPKAKIKELLDERAPFYAKIENHIDSSDLSMEEQIKEAIKILKSLK